MERLSLAALALPGLGDGILSVVIGGGALVAGLVFINLGLLLPGLLSSIVGRPASSRCGFQEFGPAAAPTISEPAPRQPNPGVATDPQPMPRPYLWRFIAGGGGSGGPASLPRLARPVLRIIMSGEPR
jgi:hypothetical protein